MDNGDFICLLIELQIIELYAIGYGSGDEGDLAGLYVQRVDGVKLAYGDELYDTMGASGALAEERLEMPDELFELLEDAVTNKLSEVQHNWTDGDGGTAILRVSVLDGVVQLGGSFNVMEQVDVGDITERV